MLDRFFDPQGYISDFAIVKGKIGRFFQRGATRMFGSSLSLIFHIGLLVGLIVMSADYFFPPSPPIIMADLVQGTVYSQLVQAPGLSTMSQPIPTPSQPLQPTPMDVSVEEAEDQAAQEAHKSTPAQKDAVFLEPPTKSATKPIKNTAQDFTIPKPSHTSLPPPSIAQRGVAAAKKNATSQDDGSYEELLRLWFAEHQPASLSVDADHEQHQVMVRIAVNTDGMIIRKSIEQSSHNPFFDNAALAIVQSSSPVPEPPFSEEEGGEIEFLVPIIF